MSPRYEGKPTRRVWHRDVLWYRACPRRLVRLIVVRDPTSAQPDDFFVTSAPAADPATIASGYTGRWSIEVTNRDAKQALGGEDPQSWKGQGPPRAAALSLWLHTAIWCWYLSTHADTTSWRTHPWYRHKHTASFADASPPCAENCGGNELQPCRPTPRSTRKSPAPCSTSSQKPPEDHQ